MSHTLHRTLNLAGALCLAACASSAPSGQQTPATPAAPRAALANLAARRVVVPPVFALDGGDSLGWAAGIANPRGVLLQLDSAITAAFDTRGLVGTWYFTRDLEQSYKLNATYAADPHRLAENGLRGKVEIGKTYGEPLATQLRTMIALQEGARIVMLPVNLRFEKAADGTAGQGQAVLKLVVVDARTTEFVWTGEVKSDPAPAFGPAALASLANHFAELVVAP